MLYLLNMLYLLFDNSMTIEKQENIIIIYRYTYQPFYLEIDEINKIIKIRERKEASFSVNQELFPFLNNPSQFGHLFDTLNKYNTHITFFVSNFLLEKSCKFFINYIGNQTITLSLEQKSERYEFEIIDDGLKSRIELRVYDKNFDYGGFGYEDVVKIFQDANELILFLETSVLTS